LLTVGGAVWLRKFEALSFGTYCDLLWGTKRRRWCMKNRSSICLGRAWNPEAGAEKLATAGCWPGHTGVVGKASETLHLKMQAMTDAIVAVRKAVAWGQRPLLTLTEGDFRVGVGRIGPNMPAFWSMRVTLRPPADAMEVQAEAITNTLYPM